MKAHIIGGGFGGLAAAAYLIRNAGVPGEDITVYEADPQMGGGLSLTGDAATGYSMPGSVFDARFRCAYDLLAAIPSANNPAVSVKEEFFTFNERHRMNDRAHIIDRDGRVVHGPRFGLTLRDGLDLARLSLTPEARLDGKRIEQFFRPGFFKSEFWLLWSTIMGSLPQHSATEFRRYMNRALPLFPDLSDMAQIMRTPLNQYQSFIEPLVAWLRPRGVNLLNGAAVQEIGLEPSAGRITVNRLEVERSGAATSVAVAPDDIVLLTTGSQAAESCVGSMTEVPQPQGTGRSWALWQRLAEGRPGFGRPDVFFGPGQVPSSRWVTFTVTTTGREFLDRMTALTGSEPGTGGLVTLKDSGWVLSVTIFRQPEVLGQPPGTSVWWGYGLYPENQGDFVRKRMDACTGAEILEETLRQLRFDRELDAILRTSLCVPCNMPWVNNIWVPRTGTDRPPVVPEGSTNLALIGQYVEVPRDIAFTIEYSARTAWEAVHRLLKRGPPPPPVYQGQFDPKALLGGLKVFLFASATRP
ncbi:MAG: oleate hydratase [Acidisphaera sp.]|nr:oleate hydratase [Acidisphaera sp.]MBV9812926.1 oleate hydratase [Acetobacteraceae bacterium]